MPSATNIYQNSQTQMRLYRRLLLAFACLFWLTVPVSAQFSSGSTGADGAFNPATSQTVQLPESGVFNFTTVNIPVNVTITFARNTRNTPVIILATGNVTINGSLNVDGGNASGPLGGVGGPGGFNGGNGGLSETNNQYERGKTGDGPGGGMGGGNGTDPGSGGIGNGGGGGFGTQGISGNNPGGNIVSGSGGPRYGIRTLIPLIGGSGGGGGSFGDSSGGGGGGGGGGALLLASSTSIVFGGSSEISAYGGGGSPAFAPGGGGSGGAIRLVANTISGTARITIAGRAGGASGVFSGGRGGNGYLRIEAFNYGDLNITLQNGGGVISRATPQPITPVNPPRLKIVSVAGVPAPAQPNGSLQNNPDIVIPASQANPVTVALEGMNVPPGTVVQVVVIPETGNRATAQSTPLAGTLATSTATASIAIPDGISVVQASATIDLTASGLTAMYINGERVQRIEMKATYGGQTEIAYVLKSGKRLTEIR